MMQQQINLYPLLPKAAKKYLDRKTALLCYGLFLCLLFIYYFIMLWGYSKQIAVLEKWHLKFQIDK